MHVSIVALVRQCVSKSDACQWYYNFVACLVLEKILIPIHQSIARCAKHAVLEMKQQLHALIVKLVTHLQAQV